MFTNCYNSGLMVGPDDFLFFVGNVKTDFAHTIHFRESVPPIVNLFKRSVPIVIKLWAIVGMLFGFFKRPVLIIKVAA